MGIKKLKFHTFHNELGEQKCNDNDSECFFLERFTIPPRCTFGMFRNLTIANNQAIPYSACPLKEVNNVY